MLLSSIAVLVVKLQISITLSTARVAALSSFRPRSDVADVHGTPLTLYR